MSEQASILLIKRVKGNTLCCRNIFNHTQWAAAKLKNLTQRKLGARPARPVERGDHQMLLMQREQSGILIAVSLEGHPPPESQLAKLSFSIGAYSSQLSCDRMLAC